MRNKKITKPAHQAHKKQKKSELVLSNDDLKKIGDFFSVLIKIDQQEKSIKSKK